jgi:hypothetical protein
MVWWLLASLAAALSSLAAARYLDGPHWLDFLWCSLAAASVAGAFVVALVAQRIAGLRWHAVAALLLALGAAVGRAWAIVAVFGAPADAPTIDVGSMALAASSIAWGALALCWGVLAVADALERPAGEPLPKARLGVAGLAVTLSLFCVAPLWRLLGLQINVYTVLGLFSLAAVAYGAGVLYRRLGGSLSKPRK